MNSAAKPLTVRILDKNYRIACPPEEQAILFRTADYVNQAMVQVKKDNQSLSIERVAVLAALNIARDLLENNPANLHQPTTDEHNQELIARIDAALQEFG